MTIKKLKPALPYVGLPALGIALLVVRVGQMDGFILLWCTLLLVFGYITAVRDIKTKKIPNSLVLAMLAAWLVTMLPMVFLETHASVTLLVDSALGFALGGGLFLLVYIISRKGLGGGDVKFMAVAGLYLGFYGVIPAMLYGTVLASLTGIVLLLSKKIGRKDTMPLAPFLFAGILITIFFM